MPRVFTHLRATRHLFGAGFTWHERPSETIVAGVFLCVCEIGQEFTIYGDRKVSTISWKNMERAWNFQGFFYTWINQVILLEPEYFVKFFFANVFIL